MRSSVWSIERKWQKKRWQSAKSTHTTPRNKICYSISWRMCDALNSTRIDGCWYGLVFNTLPPTHTQSPCQWAVTGFHFYIIIVCLCIGVTMLLLLGQTAEHSICGNIRSLNSARVGCYEDRYRLYEVYARNVIIIIDHIYALRCVTKKVTLRVLVSVFRPLRADGPNHYVMA